MTISNYNHYSSFNNIKKKRKQKPSRPKAQQLICLYFRQMLDDEPLYSQIAHIPPKGFTDRERPEDIC